MGSHMVAGGNAPSLVNGHIHDDRSCPHGLYHLFRHQLRCFGSRHQHGPDEEIRLPHPLGNIIAV